MIKLITLTLSLLLLGGCTLASSGPAGQSVTTPTPATVSDTNQQLLESLDSSAEFDFESEFNALEQDLF